MRYAKARISERKRVEAYRIYVTDVLRLIGHINGDRYIDIVDVTEKTNLNPDDVVSKIRVKLSG